MYKPLTFFYSFKCVRWLLKDSFLKCLVFLWPLAAFSLISSPGLCDICLDLVP